MQERSYLTSPSAAHWGFPGLWTGIYRGGEGGGVPCGEGRKGVSRCQSFRPDAAAVSTDDASTVSASTQLDDQLRTLWFLDIQAGSGGPRGSRTAAEHLNSGGCRIWNMFPGHPSSAHHGKGLPCHRTCLNREKECAMRNAILLRLSRDVLEERPVYWERWWSRSRQMDGDGSFWAPPFHAGGPGCRDCQCTVNYLNRERGKGKGCICHTSF